MIKVRPVLNRGTKNTINLTRSPIASAVSDREIKKHTEVTTGIIAKQIGTGDNAKDSFVWMTLRACFWIAGLASAGVFIMTAVIISKYGVYEGKEFINSLKDLWSIFTPIITLALGYAFGKRESK
ncbi:hypothetical protein D3C80_1550380 [compost metagenome]